MNLGWAPSPNPRNGPADGGTMLMEQLSGSGARLHNCQGTAPVQATLFGEGRGDIVLCSFFCAQHPAGASQSLSLLTHKMLAE